MYLIHSLLKGPYLMCWNLPQLKDMLMVCAQLQITLRSVYRFYFHSGYLLSTLGAYHLQKMMPNYSVSLHLCWTQISKNNIGPNKRNLISLEELHLRPPHFLIQYPEFFTICFLWTRNWWIQFRSSLPTPMVFSFFMSILWSTLSNALVKSR